MSNISFGVVLTLFAALIFVSMNFNFLSPTTSVRVNKPDDVSHKKLPVMLRSLQRISIKRDALVSTNNDSNCSYSHRPPFQTKNKPLQWQPVSSTSSAKAYVFSAYYDRRWNPAMVTIIGLASEYTAPQDGHRQRLCRMWFHGDNKPHTVSAYFRFENDYFRRKYTGVLYSCPASSPPYAVSLVSNCSESAGNLLEVIDAGSQHDDDSDKTRTTKGLHYTVCLSALHSNFADFRRLVETIEFNRIFGAQRFVVHLFSSSPEVRLILDSYERDGIVEIVPWHSLPTNEVHYFGQVAALNDCLYRNLLRSTFLLFADIDEIAVPRYNASGFIDDSWSGVLELATLAWSAGIGPSEERFPGAFLIRNVFFQPDYKNAADASYNMTEWLRKDNLSSGDYGFRVYSLREYRVHPYDSRPKYFALTQAVLMAGVHYPEEMFTRAANTVNVSENLCLLHHYRELVQKRRRPRIVRDLWMNRFGHDVMQRIDDRRRAVLGKRRVHR